MTYVLVKKIAITSVIALSMTACSFIDKADDYQLSRSSNTELVVPDGSVVAQDTLVIPNESNISNISEKSDFITPEIPESYLPIADLDVSWDDDLMWVETPLDLETSKVVVKNFLVSLYGEGDPIEVSSDAEIVSVPIGDQNIGGLLKLYYNITRLYPDRTVYRMVLVTESDHTKIGFQHKIVTEDQNKKINSGEWLSPDASEKEYAVALQLLSAISRESLEQDVTSVPENQDAEIDPEMWVTNNGEYVLKLNSVLKETDIAALVEKSDLYLISQNPLELAFVTEGEITKIGELKPIILPGVGGGEDVLLFNMKRRNLNNTDWQKRVYPVGLVQRTEGLFVEVDTSATEYPDVVSYRIMTALKN